VVLVGVFFLVGLWLWARNRQAPAQGSLVAAPPDALARLAHGRFPADDAGLWCVCDTPVWMGDWEGEHLWRTHDGTFFADGDSCRWLGLRNYVIVPWDSLIAVHVRPGNLVLIHGVGVQPFAVRLPNAALFQAQVATWLAHSWELQATNGQWAWVQLDI
jgi:hypothetical protein